MPETPRITKTILLGSFCLLLMSTSLLQAQKVEISPFYGYRFGGDFQDAFTGAEYGIKDAPAYGLFVDLIPAGPDMKIELLWSRQDTSLDVDGGNGMNDLDLTIDEFQVGGIAEKGDKRLRGYVSAHVGATHFSTDGYGSDTRFSLGVGGGAKYFLTRNIVLRADLRGFCTVVEAESGFIYSNGATLVVFSGSALWQGQASIGVGIAF